MLLPCSWVGRVWEWVNPNRSTPCLHLYCVYTYQVPLGPIYCVYTYQVPLGPIYCVYVHLPGTLGPHILHVHLPGTLGPHILYVHLPGTLGPHINKSVVVCHISSQIPHFIQPIRFEEVWNSVGFIVWKFPALIARENLDAWCNSYLL